MAESKRSAVLVLSTCLTVFAVWRANAQPVTPAMRTEDTRLEMPVTIVEKEICLGDLLEKVSKLSGVPVRVDPDDGGANPTVCVSVSSIRLADLMNDLWSLVSVRGCESKWTRTGTTGSYSYKLMRPGPARDLPEKLRRKMQEDFEAHVARMIRFSKMTPSDRDNLRGGAPRYDQDVIDPRSMAALQIFSDSLSADDQAAVLHDGARKVVETAGLSEAAKQFVTRWAGGALPQHVAFKVLRSPDELAPSLYMWTPDASGESGYNYAGGLPLAKVESASLAAIWLLPGDAATSDAANKTVHVQAKKTEFSSSYITSKDLERLQQLPRAERTEIVKTLNLPLCGELIDLSAGAAIPVIAELPAATQTGGRLTDGDTVSTYLERAIRPNGVPQLMAKWRDGALIVRAPAWFEHSGEHMPWGAMVELRRIAAQGIKLAPLLRTLERVTRAQMTAAKDEFPFLGWLLPHQNLLALYYKYPQILADGLAINASNMRDVRSAIGGADVDWTQALTLAVTQIDTTSGNDAVAHVMFNLTHVDGSIAWSKEVRIHYTSTPSVVRRAQ